MCSLDFCLLVVLVFGGGGGLLFRPNGLGGCWFMIVLVRSRTFYNLLFHKEFCSYHKLCTELFPVPGVLLGGGSVRLCSVFFIVCF